MAIEFHITRHEGFFEVSTDGDADFASLAAMINALTQQPEWAPGASVIIDYSRVNASPLQIGEVMSLAELVSAQRERIGPARVAHIVSRKVEYGLVRMWDAYVNENWDGTAKIFNSRDEAVAWLTAGQR